ncbi:MAG: 3-hydroxyacyl-CoA dehydrogenase NAD-binding domain-containing protein [Sphingomonas sp.]|jgi:3-hydroxybutyryl-CoA dehydrogenase|uniref:3-hydroxyacyl-CoA dehydrogenase NAD-binding domain-containing protein n=1 Tax=Sphingomonas sp. TaxID=28214 RepID=UPI00356B4985
MEIHINSPIAVIGAGTMGAGIAQVAATAGHMVTVIDRDEAALAQGRSVVATVLASSVAKGRLDDRARSDIEARIRWSTDPSQVAHACLVVEAIVERLDAKHHLLGAIERVVGRDALIASNTSSLGIGDIAAVLTRPERFLGLHFFNPVPSMKLVEIVAGPATGPMAVDAVSALMRIWGKRPVVVREVPGFIVNRVARPYYAEGFAALGEGIAPAAIDAALTGAAGFRMGPLALGDMIGHDVNFAVATSVYEAYRGKTRFRPQESQRSLVEAGRFGRKTRHGVYDYNQPLPVPDCLRGGSAPASITVSQIDLLAPLVADARSHGITVVEDSRLGPDALSVDGSLMALGDGRPLASRCDIDVLIDHARDFSSATHCVISARSAEHADRATGFLRALGREALQVPDRPGQIVLRTLAQLANAAADAVRDEVATASGIDEAMIFGANHPEGPLGWAGRIGDDRVRASLSNIAAASGDPIYAPSPMFGVP